MKLEPPKLTEDGKCYLITREHVNSIRTLQGGWTRKQLDCLGIAWPPRRGWFERWEGAREIPKERWQWALEDAPTENHPLRGVPPEMHYAITLLCEQLENCDPDLRFRVCQIVGHHQNPADGTTTARSRKPEDWTLWHRPEHGTPFLIDWGTEEGMKQKLAEMKIEPPSVP